MKFFYTIFNKILKRVVNFFSGFYLLFSWTAFFCFSRNADLTDWRFRFKHKFIIQYSYRLEKKKFTALSRVWKFWGCQNSAIIMTNGIRKVWKGVDTFIKRILILVSSSRTQCFSIRPLLHQSFPCKLLSDTMLQHTASSTSIFSLQAPLGHNLQNTVSSTSIFSLQEAEFLPLVARGRGKKTAENPLLFCTIIFLQNAKCKIPL